MKMKVTFGFLFALWSIYASAITAAHIIDHTDHWFDSSFAALGALIAAICFGYAADEWKRGQ